jgi:formin-binding protein 1
MIISSGVSEGTRVKVLEEDDGSGWVKIFKESTEKSGLVPASYLKLDSDEDSDDEVAQPELSMPVPNVSQVPRSGKYGKLFSILAITVH